QADAVPAGLRSGAVLQGGSRGALRRHRAARAVARRALVARRADGRQAVAGLAGMSGRSSAARAAVSSARHAGADHQQGGTIYPRELLGDQGKPMRKLILLVATLVLLGSLVGPRPANAWVVGAGLGFGYGGGFPYAGAAYPPGPAYFPPPVYYPPAYAQPVYV